MNDDINIYTSTNLQYLRKLNKKTQQDIGNLCNKGDTAVSNWEKGIRDPDGVDLAKISNYFGITVDDLMFKDLRFDNADKIELPTQIVKIPVYGTIKAGTPIEAQTDIIDYVNIPEEMTKGGKKFYGLKIKGDSMAPTYLENDIVIFEHNEDISIVNGKDCAIMVNGFDATFKNVRLNQSGITLIPLNINNEDGYEPTFYDNEQIEKLPVRIIGIARKIERNLD